MTDNERAFVIGLEKLTRETGIMISGCGCCGSPRLEPVDGTEDGAGYLVKKDMSELEWVSPSSNEFAWNSERHMIVKEKNNDAETN